MARPWNKNEELRLAEHANFQEASYYIHFEKIRTDFPQTSAGRKDLIKHIYETLLHREKKIRYAFELYNPNDEIQDIRTPREILVSSRVGTCLDLSVLFCSLCLANELLPLLIIIKGHAFAAVSLDQGLREWNSYSRTESNLFQEKGFCTEVKEIKELIDDGKYIAVECTGFAQSNILSEDFPEGKERNDGLLSFEQAVTAGRDQLKPETNRSFKFALDLATTQFAKGISVFKPDAGTPKFNPFKLLEPYTIADTSSDTDEQKVPNRFFGRKDEIKKVIESIEKHSFIFIHGETGKVNPKVKTANLLF